MAETLLLIEDEDLLRSELERYFRKAGWKVAAAASLAQARAMLLDALHPLVVVSDMSLPDGNALDLLEAAGGQGDVSEWLFLTGFGGVADSVRALRLGAYDFLEKPCDLGHLDLVVAGAARSARAQRQLRAQSVQLERRYAPAAFVGRSAAARRVRDMLERLGTVPLSVLLLTGETGTGKGLAARILHHAGRRRQAPLVEVNCAALPHDLLESELFGHEAGAFTGARERRRGLMEQAQGGTLFLDEIGELTLDLQAKLLTAIEDRRVRRLGGATPIDVDIQIVAASNRDLAQRSQNGAFRSDLLHRITLFTLELPALRHRLEDLEDLVPALVAEFNVKAGKAVREIREPVWTALRRHPWPGNVRELRNAIERCVLLSDNAILPAQWLQLQPVHPSAQEPREPAEPLRRPDGLCFPLDGSMTLDQMEREILDAALQRERFNVAGTARLLGVTRETLRYRAKKHGLGTEE